MDPVDPVDPAEGPTAVSPPFPTELPTELPTEASPPFPTEASPPFPTELPTELPTEVAAPPAAAEVFGARLDLARRYAELLADTGVAHGLVGPREVPRLWQRHLLNCALLAVAVPDGVEVIDVGSGAGLPGIVLAIARPDLRVHLVEPLLRRTTWLETSVEQLGLSEQVTVHRARAEELAGALAAPVVTARAVAALGTLAAWCRPLVAPDGELLAMKGERAADELARDRAGLRRLGATHATVEQFGVGLVDPPTTVVRLRFAPARVTGHATRSEKGRRGAARGKRS